MGLGATTVSPSAVARPRLRRALEQPAFGACKRRWSPIILAIIDSHRPPSGPALELRKNPIPGTNPAPGGYLVPGSLSAGYGGCFACGQVGRPRLMACQSAVRGAVFVGASPRSRRPGRRKFGLANLPCFGMMVVNITVGTSFRQRSYGTDAATRRVIGIAFRAGRLLGLSVRVLASPRHADRAGLSRIPRTAQEHIELESTG